MGLAFFLAAENAIMSNPPSGGAWTADPETGEFVPETPPEPPVAQDKPSRKSAAADPIEEVT